MLTIYGIYRSRASRNIWLAINLYLAKKHGGPLAPKNVVEDGEMGMWALWSVTEVEPHALPIAQNGPSDAAVDALRAPFAVLDKALGKTGFVVGARFTVADINVAE